jgi:hypothetical protein
VSEEHSNGGAIFSRADSSGPLVKKSGRFTSRPANGVLARRSGDTGSPKDHDLCGFCDFESDEDRFV